jgi:hypothetical protein
VRRALEVEALEARRRGLVVEVLADVEGSLSAPSAGELEAACLAELAEIDLPRLVLGGLVEAALVDLVGGDRQYGLAGFRVLHHRVLRLDVEDGELAPVDLVAHGIDLYRRHVLARHCRRGHAFAGPGGLLAQHHRS